MSFNVLYNINFRLRYWYTFCCNCKSSPNIKIAINIKLANKLIPKIAEQ